MSRFAFLADKSYVVGAIEQCLLTADVAPGATSITIDTSVLVDLGAGLAAGDFVLRDNSGAAGTPNCEVIHVSAIGAPAGGHQTLTCSAVVGTYTIAHAGAVLTPGNEMTLASADFNCRLRGVSCTPKWDEDDSNSKYATGDHGEDESIAGARSGEISFSDKLAVPNPSALSTIPVWEKFMRGCGFETTIYSGHGIEFLPLAAADNTTMTLWHIYKENAEAPRATALCFAGCKASSGDIGCAGIGKPYMLNAKFTGKYTRSVDLTNAQILLLTSPETTIPEKMLSNSVATNFGTAFNLMVSNWKLDFGIETQGLINQADATGYEYFSIVSRKPRLTIDPIMYLLANENFDSLVSNETIGTVTIASALSAPHITVAVPRAQLITPAIAAREGYVAQNRTYRCLRNTGGSVPPPEACFSILIGARS